MEIIDKSTCISSGDQEGLVTSGLLLMIIKGCQVMKGHVRAETEPVVTL